MKKKSKSFKKGDYVVTTNLFIPRRGRVKKSNEIETEFEEAFMVSSTGEGFPHWDIFPTKYLKKIR